MSTKVTIVLWDPEGRTEETWDRVVAALAQRHRAEVVDVETEELGDSPEELED